jgi:hypothetical protein
MATDTHPATRGPGYAGRPITKPPDWHGLVAWDMMLNNLTAGLFLVAALGELAMPRTFAPVASAAYPIALGLLLLDLLFLTLDLGDPWRFHHMLRVFKPSSPMSLGTWSLTVYSLPLTIIVATELWSFMPAAGGTVAWIRTVALASGLLPAIAVAVYKGVLLSTTAQPGWKDARCLGAYLANAAVMLGCAELLALAVALGQSAAEVLRPTLLVLLMMNAIPVCLLLREVQPTLRRRYSRPRAVWLGALVLGGGMFVPLCLLAGTGNAAATLIAVALILLSSVVARFVIVAIPQPS